VFSAIEAPEEAARVRELKDLRQDFLDGHTCVGGIYISHHYLCIRGPREGRGVVGPGVPGCFGDPLK